jgi:hypothetical protein
MNALPARLLFIYFTGDTGEGRVCPADEAGWRSALAAQDEHVGLPEKGYALKGRIHSLSLPVFASVGPEHKPEDKTKVTERAVL